MSFIRRRHSNTEHNLKIEPKSAYCEGTKHMVDAHMCVMLLMLMLMLDVIRRCASRAINRSNEMNVFSYTFE